MTNHQCSANIAYEPCWISTTDGSTCAPGLRFVALKDIPAGSQLCHSYVDPAAHVLDRQTRLRQGYGFDCSCSKCEAELEAMQADGEQAEVED